MQPHSLSPPVVETAEDHLVLKHELSELLSELGQPEVSLVAVRDRLQQFVRRTLQHFESEAASGGFFSDLLARAPQLHRQATALLHEHLELRADLCALEQRAARAVDTPWARQDLACQLQDLADAFLTHEAAESALLLSVYSHDLGTGAD